MTHGPGIFVEQGRYLAGGKGDGHNSIAVEPSEWRIFFTNSASLGFSRVLAGVANIQAVKPRPISRLRDDGLICQSRQLP